MKKLPLLLFLLLGTNVACFADDSDQVYGDTSSGGRGLSVTDRITVLERQVANLNQQNGAGQVQDLQNQLNDLKGRVETLEHEFQLQSDQIKQQYKDLDQRIQDISKANVATPDTNADVKTAKKNSQLEANEQALEKPATNNVSPNNVAAEQAAYQKVLALLKAHDYPRATPKLQDFLSKYPNGVNAPNAHFWLGEVYLLQGQPDQAAVEYRTVINNYPSSEKYSMAQLKLAFAYQDQGSTAKARAQYQKVIKNFPGTPAAKLASQRLAQLPANKKTAGV